MSGHNDAELRAFIKYLIKIQLGRIKFNIRSFESYRDCCKDSMKKEGIQDCIDVLQDSYEKGMSIPEEVIYKRAADFENDPEFRQFLKDNAEWKDAKEDFSSLFASKMSGKDDN